MNKLQPRHRLGMPHWVARLTTIATLSMALVLPCVIQSAASVHAANKPIYDLSEYQRRFTGTTAKLLKAETSFVILKAQNGSAREDPVFVNNAQALMKVGVPFGAYSYSCYTSSADAQNEAKLLYQRAPHARFYVNDCEENDVKSGTLSAATIAWAQEMHHLTNKPVVLYSGLCFLNDHLLGAKASYNAIWLADYTKGEPNPAFHYDLWQYTDHQNSVALGQQVDASMIPAGGKPLSFWTGNARTKAKVVDMKNQQTSNSGYYTSNNIKTLVVTSKNGLPIFNQNHQYLCTKPQGTVIKITKIYPRNGAYVAVTANHNLCVTNKALVTANIINS